MPAVPDPADDRRLPGARHHPENPGRMRKVSVSIRGHRTSFSIEELFYGELVALARARGYSLARLVAQIDAGRDPEQNLSSAIRLHVLAALIEDRRRNPR